LPNVFDALTPLVGWVEKGTARIRSSRPVRGRHAARRRDDAAAVVYPKVAKYNGSGGTGLTQNFTCVTDERDFNQTPAPQFGP
jgi:feruloyl esterase